MQINIFISMKMIEEYDIKNYTKYFRILYILMVLQWQNEIKP